MKLKAIMLLGLCGVTLGGALFVVLTNMGNTWEVHLFWKTIPLKRGTMLLWAGTAGAVLWAIWRTALPAGFRAAKQCRKTGAAKATADRLKKLESGSEPKPPAT